jgi:hypothetical protein
MLIIAMPKSASTTLVATLGESHGLPVASQQLRDEILLRRRIAPGYWHAAQFHRRDFVEIDDRIASLIAGPDLLAKFHFPPTPTNQAVLREVKKVILLRDPTEVVSAYRRGEETGSWPTKSYEFAFCFSEDGWQRRARETGLIDELRRFAEGWREHDGEKLVIESAELVADPRGALARVEAYFGLPISGSVELRQERFSRAIAPRSRPRLLWGRRRLILRRAIAGANRLVAGDADWANRVFERFKRTRAASDEGAVEDRATR